MHVQPHADPASLKGRLGRLWQWGEGAKIDSQRAAIPANPCVQGCICRRPGIRPTWLWIPSLVLGKGGLPVCSISHQEEHCLSAGFYPMKRRLWPTLASWTDTKTHRISTKRRLVYERQADMYGLSKVDRFLCAVIWVWFVHKYMVYMLQWLA